MYVETSSQVKGGKARLISNLHYATDGQCLVFYYHMYGTAVGSLNVYTRQAGLLGSVVWTLAGDQGDRWYKGMVDVASSTTFNVVFEGVVGSNVKGDIAIDDVFLLDQACPNPDACDFEFDLCSWNNEQGDDFDWIRHKGVSTMTSTGAQGDHTLNGTGYYLLADSYYPRAKGSKANIVSIEFSKDEPQCMTFWYYMHGKTIGSLNLYARKSVSNTNETLWGKALEQGNTWLFGFVTIANMTENYVLVLEAVIGDVYYSDMAIDDFNIMPGVCVNDTG
ncbi:PREDICTED: MAM and LDL-receptor class A domain-containing protein 1-like [Priapulus caudatus]|uniref:MAM and LDL-receptor class A domain-containing protein 1-like n=1 Tax=Priapulus caudatus TaxID=37621 RepID=A0ABM1F969_PRICU|nr:PREDICTED: MAM and LDL-receptor class A domain-containing protein 1-like [Priapulus caudatus]